MTAGTPGDDRESRRRRREARRRAVDQEPRRVAPDRRDYRHAPRPGASPRPSGTRHRHRLAWLAALVLVVGGFGYLALKELGDRRGGTGGAPVSTTPAGPEVIARVTFPEGLRREEMAQILKDKVGMSPQRYLELTGPGARGRRLAGASQPRSLEGFLFPATYDITKGMTPAQVVDAQIAAYEQNVANIDYSYARGKNLTRYDVLIIASMIEREVRVPDERALVAGVIYNRLRKGMILGIDATVQYALGSWKTELTVSDLATDSSYNTRKFAGLPPGPICSPGAASINAAAHPKGTYLYYVARNDGSGGHFFARTEAEFEQAVARSRANAGG